MTNAGKSDFASDGDVIRGLEDALTGWKDAFESLKQENARLRLSEETWKYIAGTEELKAKQATSAHKGIVKALEEARTIFLRINEIIDTNLYHQREKVEGARSMAFQAAEKIDAALKQSEGTQ